MDVDAPDMLQESPAQGLRGSQRRRIDDTVLLTAVQLFPDQPDVSSVKQLFKSDLQDQDALFIEARELLSLYDNRVPSFNTSDLVASRDLIDHWHDRNNSFAAHELQKFLVLLASKRRLLQAPDDDLGRADQVKSVKEAWEHAFKGSAPQRFCLALRRHQIEFAANNKAENDKASNLPYACYFAVINSSGTGKSRLMSEVARTIFSIPLCLRPQGTSGFPPADMQVLECIDSFRDESRNLNEWVVFFSVFLREIFRNLLGIAAGNSGKLDKAQFRQAMMRFGDKYEAQGEYRSAFYDSAVERTQAFVSSVDTSRWQDDDVRKHVRETAEVLQKVLQTLDGAPDDDYDPFRTLLLVIDEAHSLNFAIRGRSLGQSCYASTALRRVMYDLGRSRFGTNLRNIRFCVVVMSTTGRARQFYPRSEHDPSRRLIEKEYRLIPPFVNLGLDQLVPTGYLENLHGKNVQIVGSVETFWPFGRPLFATYWQAASDSNIDYDLASFALTKLLGNLCRPPVTLRQSRAIDPMSFSLFAVRLPLPLDSADPDVWAAADTMVESHLRICLGVNAREDLETIAYSEPILAAVSAYTMTHYIDALQHLNCHLGAIGADRGVRGEIVGMFALLCAHDAAIHHSLGDVVERDTPMLRATSTSDHINPTLEYARPVLLATFLTSLTGEPCPSDIPHAFVHFTHFVRMEESFGDEANTADRLLELFVRGAALQCVAYEHSIDAILPVCYSDSLGPEYMGAIVVHFKNRQTFSDHDQNLVLDSMDSWRDKKFFRPRIDRQRPGINILMNFGITSPSTASWVDEPGRVPGDAYCLVMNGIDGLPCFSKASKSLRNSLLHHPSPILASKIIMAPMTFSRPTEMLAALHDQQAYTGDATVDTSQIKRRKK